MTPIEIIIYYGTPKGQYTKYIQINFKDYSSVLRTNNLGPYAPLFENVLTIRSFYLDAKT